MSQETATHIAFPSGSAPPRPPFWALEVLIGQGMTLERSLAILAARRTPVARSLSAKPKQPSSSALHILIPGEARLGL